LQYTSKIQFPVVKNGSQECVTILPTEQFSVCCLAHGECFIEQFSRRFSPLSRFSAPRTTTVCAWSCWAIVTTVCRSSRATTGRRDRITRCAAWKQACTW